MSLSTALAHSPCASPERQVPEQYGIAFENSKVCVLLIGPLRPFDVSELTVTR